MEQGHAHAMNEGRGGLVANGTPNSVLEYHTQKLFKSMGEQLRLAERDDDIARNEGEGRIASRSQLVLKCREEFS